MKPRDRTGLNLYRAEMRAAYQKARRIPEEVLSVIRRASGATIGTRVLDLGTGPGFLAISLAQVGAEALGIDISPSFIAMAKASAERENVHATFLEKDAHYFDSSAFQFDVVTACQVMHWLNPTHVLDVIEKALVPHGTFLIIEAEFILGGTHPLTRHFGARVVPTRMATNETVTLPLLGSAPAPRLFHQASYSVLCKAHLDRSFALAYLFPPRYSDNSDSVGDSWLRALDAAFEEATDASQEGQVLWRISQYVKEQ